MKEKDKTSESRPKASWVVRFFALFCLCAVLLAVFRVISCDSISSAWTTWQDFPFFLKCSLGLMLPFSLYASIYILVTGRIPSTSKWPIKLEENPYKTRFDKIGIAIVWTAIAAFIGSLIWVAFFF
jgi:uncharacterized integral membrane protein